MFKDWVVDVTMARDDMLCFCPIENIGTPEEKIVFGLNLLTTPEGFKEGKRGKVVAIIHEDGQCAVEKWIADNSEILKRLKEG